MDEAIMDALSVETTVDITTTGRRSGRPRRIEIWSFYVDGKVLLMGYQGKHGWYANLLANPELIYHLKVGRRSDLPAAARIITDKDERRLVLTRLKEQSRFYQGKPASIVEEWVRESALVEVMLK